MLCKLLENPSREYAPLLQEFTDGFYGAAGTEVRAYLAELQKQALTPDATWFAPLSQHTYLTLDFLQRAAAIFDRAAQAVAGDAILSRRVRHARFSLDRAVLALIQN